MYPYQHDAERRMTERAREFVEPSEIERRILNQLARELLLAQSSDWAFQIYQGTTVEYSSRRFRSHIHRFDLLAKMLENVSNLSQDDLELLFEIESRDNIFPEIDYRAYA
jgi:1,4-alpha-glucan branching enzyme